MTGSGFGSYDFIVSPRSWEGIERVANGVRETLGVNTRPRINMRALVEDVMDTTLGLFTFLVGEPDEMEMTEGLTALDGSTLCLRQDVYDNLCVGQGRARFTAAHELGHWYLHVGQKVALARNAKNKVEAYRLSEPQANRFASALLMPWEWFEPSDTVEIIVRRFGVSKAAAKLRLDEYRKKIDTGGQKSLL